MSIPLRIMLYVFIGSDPVKGGLRRKTAKESRNILRAKKAANKAITDGSTNASTGYLCRVKNNRDAGTIQEHRYERFASSTFPITTRPTETNLEQVFFHWKNINTFIS